jgi:GT2 family glycosyltransferase
MPDRPRISVVVVSSGRPRALCRCLLALSQMQAPMVEVIVVADADGIAALGHLPFKDRLIVRAQAQSNISIARNDGIAAAAGDIVAFIDDDAVPEPTWARALSDAFADPGLDAATGPVLGRNGISLQWGRIAVDRLGRDRWMPAGDGPHPDEALKLHGTNMAFRRATLDRIGGFDGAFGFYLDDTDLALRLAGAGGRMDFVAGAVVHHGFAASTRRTQDRVPLSLYDIGASTAVFLRKHALAAEHADALAALETDQRARLLRLARKRKLDAGAMRDLMEGLLRGIAEGAARPFGVTSLAHEGRAFAPLNDSAPPPMQALSAWSIHAARLRSAAADRVASGQPVTLFLFEPTPRKHKVQFTEGGWWEQTGGLYGPSDRAAPRFQAWGFSRRARAEQQRVADLRGLRPASG